MSARTNTERKLQEALDAFAETVRSDLPPDAYRKALREWQRREWRRRLVLTIVTVVVFALAVIAGVLVLNYAASAEQVTSNGSSVTLVTNHPAPLFEGALVHGP